MSWASAYVGRPFADYKCWALVCLVYHEQLGIQLPEYGEVDDRSLLAIARSMGRDSDLYPWSEPSGPARPFDVALMTSKHGGSLVTHVGVMVDARMMLHTEEASAAVCIPVSHPSVRCRLRGLRRHVKCQ